MHIEVTAEDVRNPGTRTLDNPVTCALRRATGHQWYIYNYRIACEVEEPYGVIRLPETVVALLGTWKASRLMEPFAFEATLSAPFR